MTLGAVDYVRKPIKKEVLLLRVRTALRRLGIDTRVTDAIGEANKITKSESDLEALDVS